MLVPGTVDPLPATSGKLVSTCTLFHEHLRQHQGRTLLTLAHLADSLAGFVGLLRLPAAHVVAVAQDVADGAGSGLEASWGELLVDGCLEIFAIDDREASLVKGMDKCKTYHQHP